MHLWAVALLQRGSSRRPASVPDIALPYPSRISLKHPPAFSSAIHSAHLNCDCCCNLVLRTAFVTGNFQGNATRSYYFLSPPLEREPSLYVSHLRSASKDGLAHDFSGIWFTAYRGSTSDLASLLVVRLTTGGIFRLHEPYNRTHHNNAPTDRTHSACFLSSARPPYRAPFLVIGSYASQWSH